ncbi:hypothetical protein T07_11204 [Trichinella nelsoni]|uniref:Uncharacterized protein n=1 Tax=Trichinella nelsoni TaxID=6336 RepID=A0A0V0RU68_9BILA|nr:hypothetical protein T07_11204 [Trichinella nelsoni]
MDGQRRIIILPFLQHPVSKRLGRLTGCSFSSQELTVVVLLVELRGTFTDICKQIRRRLCHLPPDDQHVRKEVDQMN